MTDLPAGPPPSPAPPRSPPATLAIWFFVLAALLSGVGFCVKIYEFTDDLLEDQGIGFAGAHLVTYALVALGFLLLLAGTFLRGHWSDIEKPKFEMLERERLHDRIERPGFAVRR